MFFRSKQSTSSQRRVHNKLQAKVESLEARRMLVTTVLAPTDPQDVTIDDGNLIDTKTGQILGNAPDTIVGPDDRPTTVRIRNAGAIDNFRFLGGARSINHVFVEAGGFDHVSHVQTSKQDGFINLDNQSIRYENVTVVTDLTVASTKEFVRDVRETDPLDDRSMAIRFRDFGRDDDGIVEFDDTASQDLIPQTTFRLPQVGFSVSATKFGDVFRLEGEFDTEVPADFSITIDGLDGPDRFEFATANFPLTLIGNDGADTIIGGRQGDTLRGEDGNDTIIGNEGRDFIFGGDGEDNLQGGPGNDRIDAGDNPDIVDGGDGNDELFGGDGPDTIRGGAGDDFIRGFEGRDVIFGDAGNDEISGDPGNDQISGGDGNDNISGGDGLDILQGDAGEDVLLGGGQADQLDGGFGNDILEGGNGDDQLLDEAGTNTLRGDKGNDILIGGAGPDDLDGGPGDDSLAGAGGNDTLADKVGNDIFDGGDGDDLFRIVPEKLDVIIDSGGNDTLDYSLFKSPVVVDLDLLNVDQETRGKKRLLNIQGQIENFIGTKSNDTVFIDPLDVVRTIDGAGNKKRGDGDILFVDAKNNLVEIDGDSITVDDFAAILATDIETRNLENNPPGVGGSVHGRHYQDSNGNGVFDEDDVYAGGPSFQLIDLDGVEVATTAAEDADANDDGTVTEEELGVYAFTKARPGTFIVEQVNNDAWLSSEAIDQASILAYELDSTYDLELDTSRVASDVKWLTGTDGEYYLTDAGTLSRWDEVNESQPTGEVIGQLAPVFYNHVDLLTDAVEPADTTVEWRPGESVVNLDFGSIPLGSLSGQAWDDTNANGERDSDEAWLIDTQVQLFDEFGDLIANDVSESSDRDGNGWVDPNTEAGWFDFEYLLPGIYTARFEGVEQEFEVGGPVEETSQGNPERLPGDANLDGVVGFPDFLIVSAAFGTEDAFWADGDFDGNGIVNFADFLILSNSFGQTA